MKENIKRVLRRVARPFIGSAGFNQTICYNDLREFNSEINLNSYLVTNKDVLGKSNKEYIINISSDSVVYHELLENYFHAVQLMQKEDDSAPIKERKSFESFKSYFDTFQPKNVMEFLKVDFKVQTPEQKLFFYNNPLSRVYPWEDFEPEDILSKRQLIAKAEFERHSNRKYSDKDGFKSFGPISDTYLMVEYERLLDVYLSIKKNGFVEKYGFPRLITVFTDGETYLYHLEAAWHRTGVLLGLLNQNIPVVLSKDKVQVVSRNEVDKWPQVIKGIYSKELALQIFDNKFVSLKNA